jgi:cobalamin biosynthesis protein CobT
MMREFPGTRLHLEPLNSKWRKKALKAWNEIPWPVRTIMGIRDKMAGEEVKVDPDTKRYLDATEELALKLRDATNTTEMREITHEIVKIIQDENEKQQEENDESNDDMNEGAKGGASKDSHGQKSEGQDKEDSEGQDKEDSEGSPSDKGEQGEGDSQDGEGEGSESPDGKPSEGEGEGEGESDHSEMVHDKDSSKFDEHQYDVHSHMNEELEKAIKDDAKGKPRKDLKNDFKDEWSNKPYVAATTRFDQVTDHTGKGDYGKYSKLRREVNKYVGNIKRELERVLKVKENARWKVEEERGSINSRALASLATNKSYRTPFKQFKKTETDNVAVEILVDMSGSMGGRMDTAKRATVAMAEALKALDIQFEVTGFYSEHDRKVTNYVSKLKGDKKRFSRKSESLRLHVFKDFDATSLTGIEKMYVGSQNPDGECVRWAAKRLEARKQKRKILIVMSDGMPATGEGAYGVLNADLKKTVAQLKKAKIEVVGFGIQTDSVKHFYDDTVVINNLSELPTKAMKKLSKVLASGI